MKVAIISNDFRVYWKGRLSFLHPFLQANGISLEAVELFGKGSPYAFDAYSNNDSWWHCLFPQKSADELSKTSIETELFKILDEINPDIVITSPITFFAGGLGLRWAKARKRKYIMFDDAKPLVQFKRNFVVQWVRNLITAQADALWLPDEHYNTAYPALAGKNVSFFYGFNSIDNDLFKNESGWQADSNTIICVARLVPIKNIDNLLRAWQIVEQSYQAYQLLIIGDGPCKVALQQLSDSLALKNVRFLGAINNSGLPIWFSRASAFILPSLSETWGLVVNEAMAASLPVLLSNKVNAAQSLLHEGVNGFSFDPVVVTDIAAVIIRYINLTQAKKAQMATQSLSFINEMSYQKMGGHLLDALPAISRREFKKPGIIASTIINLWSGKHDTSAWDNL